MDSLRRLPDPALTPKLARRLRDLAHAARAVLLPGFLLLSACSHDLVERHEDEVFRVDGDTWTYTEIEINRTYTGLTSGHGLFGERNGYRQQHLLRSAQGETIAAQTRIYALQKDGTYKHITCCNYFREQGRIWDIGGTMVLVFANAREFITDCFIYPAGKPDNEFEPDPGKRYYGPTIYAVFDPREKVFKADTFDAGDTTDEDYRRAEQALGVRHYFLPEAESVALDFAHRRPFLCDDPRAVKKRCTTSCGR